MSSTSVSGQNLPGMAPELILQTGHSQWVNSVALSHDGRWLASAGADHTVIVWDVASGLEFRMLTGHAEAVTAVAFSPDGALLASGGSDNNIKLWDFSAGKELFNLATGNHPLGVMGVAFDPSGKKLISLNQDRTVITWDVARGREQGRFAGLAAPSSGTAYFTDLTPDAHWVMSDRSDRTVGRKAIDLWDVTTGKLAYSRLTSEDMTGGKLSGDGRFFAYTDSHDGFGLWDIAKGQVAFSIPGRRSVITHTRLSCAFSSDARLLAVQDPDNGNIRIVDVATGSVLRTFPFGGRGSLRFSDDDRSLAAADGGKIVLIDVEGGRAIRQMGGYTRSIGALAISGDGRFLSLQNQDDNSVALWDLKLGRQMHSFKGNDNNVGAAAVALNGDGRLVAAQMRKTADSERATVIRETATGAEVASIPGPDDYLTSLSLNPDGSMLAAGGYQGSMRVWDTRTCEELLSLSSTGILSPKCRVAFSFDGHWLAAVAPDSVVIWNTERKDWTASIHAGYVLAIAFSPDGGQIASADLHNRSITVWNLDTGGTEIVSIDGQPGVTALAFGSGGRMLAASYEDHCVRLWDSASGTLIRELAGHGGEVRDVIFTPDGRWLISAGAEGSVRIWDPSNGTTVAILCSTAGPDDWVAITPQGLFDGSQRGSRHLVAWRIGDRVLAASQFYSEFSRPGLLAQVLSGAIAEPAVPMAGLRMPPSVQLVSPPGARIVPNQQVQVTVEARDEGAGVAQVRLYHNGKLAGARQPVPGAAMRYTFDILLIPGQENTLRAIAYGTNGLEGMPDEVVLVFQAPAPPKPGLYMVAVGINEYQDRNLHLDYAQPDAQALASFIQSHGNLFRSVDVIQLFNEKATKAAIEDALEQLVLKANPEDVAVLYFAGHGILIGPQFYFLPEDMCKEADLAGAVQKYGIPASALGDALLRMKAVKQLLILDACQSESALPALARATFGTRGIEKPEERAVRMLAHANGIYLIAASTAEQYAYEIPELGHGVFTYALLAGLGENGEPQAVNPEGIVTVLSLINYVTRTVPELTEKYHMGNSQLPVIFDAGTDIPLLAWAKPGNGV